MVMIDMMSVAMSRTMRDSCLENWARVCTVASGSSARDLGRRARWRSTPGLGADQHVVDAGAAQRGELLERRRTRWC